MGEFDLIQRYFTTSNIQRRDVLLSIGDDCAITQVPANQNLAITTDTLVEGVHFYSNIKPEDLAYKSLAVNLSDLAAMGAEPAWASLAITLPKIDNVWLERFSNSFSNTLNSYNLMLIGGDTTKGRLLTLTLTLHGLLPTTLTGCRHQAKVGDWIYVTGSLGDSAAGLQILTESMTAKEPHKVSSYLINRHLRPSPRVLFGQTIAPYISAAIDVSDGLLADLMHILERSQVGAVLDLEALPLSKELIDYVGLERAQSFALTGGEDYELCFCIADINVAKLEQELVNIGVNYTRIGRITCDSDLVLRYQGDTIPLPQTKGFDHFGK